MENETYSRLQKLCSYMICLSILKNTKIHNFIQQFKCHIALLREES